MVFGNSEDLARTPRPRERDMRRVGSGKRGWVLFALGLVAVPLSVAAVAYACTSIATLSLSRASARPGSVVTIKGKYFETHHGSSPGVGSVKIKIGSLSGRVLATANPTGTDRSFTVSVRIPKGTHAGMTFFVATQRAADGTWVYGTPARQVIKIL